MCLVKSITSLYSSLVFYESNFLDINYYLTTVIFSKSCFESLSNNI